MNILLIWLWSKYQNINIDKVIQLKNILITAIDKHYYIFIFIKTLK